jgi:hypothetical protein
MMKLIMKLDDLDEILESQEELLRLERKKNLKLLKRTLPMEGWKTRGLRTL